MASINIFELVRIARRLGLPLRVLIAVIALDLLSICFEVVGIGMLLPIFELLRAGNSVTVDQLHGPHWTIVRSAFGVLGLQPSLGILFVISFINIVLRQVLGYLSARYNGLVRRRTGDKLRQRIFYQYLLAGSARQDETSLGEIVSVLKMDLTRGLDVIFNITRSVGTVVQASIYLGGLFFLSWRMTALSVVAIAIAILFSRGYFRQIKRMGAAMTVSNRQLTAFLVERLRHARLIRLSGTEKAESRAVYRLSRQFSSDTLEQSLVSTRLTLLPEPIAVGFTYLILFVGANVFGFSLEKLGLFVVILVRMMPIIRGNISRYAATLGKMPSLERLDAYFTDISEAREPKGGDRVFAQLEHEITYDHVSFTYATNDTPALRDISVTIPAHCMSALIGPSGAGKSTFVDLLPLLRVPSAGMILIDGVPIAEFSTASLRAGIAFVPQMPQIFNITIAEHIRYGKDDATDNEVREAARLAGALTFIESLPRGFDTFVGDDGLRLSGGQRQRLDIARALVRRAPILILDEPTSALDADAEAAFRDALNTLRAETNLTIIVIAHRLSTVVDADHIIVLNRGRVMAAGSHTELIKAGGWYADALRKQHLGAIDFEPQQPSLVVGAEQVEELLHPRAEARRK